MFSSAPDEYTGNRHIAQLIDDTSKLSWKIRGQCFAKFGRLPIRREIEFQMSIQKHLVLCSAFNRALVFYFKRQRFDHGSEHTIVTLDYVLYIDHDLTPMT